jgi:SAM-dependent methyltransferase
LAAARREYVSGRPDYPDALLADLPAAQVIVELGAGTGKFTRLLAGIGAKRIIAVEPQPAMAVHIPKADNIEVVAGTAEQIPLPDRADLVCCACAFHWFDYAKATAEILRVMRPGAHLAVVWNMRDERTAWVAEISRLFDAYRSEPRRYGSRPLLGDARFELVRQSQYAFEHRMPPSGIVDRVLSTSFIAALPDAEQEIVRQRVLAAIAARPELRGASEIGFPYLCELYLLRRRP